MAKIFLEKEEGLALIVSVGILALMALIATSFAINMQLDYKIAANFRDSLKARYLAESGINRAIAELAYGTEGAINTAVDTEGEKWYASEPYKDDTLLDGKGSYAVTKIRDLGSQIYINDANSNLSAILENLVSALGSPLTPGDGNAIVANRPPLKIDNDGRPVGGGYTTKEQIKTISGFDDAKYNAIKDHITVFAFVDSDVINPKDTTTPYAASPRAPINVNTASKEVLIAVLTGISDGTNSISKSEAEELAEHLINGRSYGTYDELWIRLLTAETLTYIEDGDAAVVMANANPNTDLMRANPNYSWRYKHVSKEGYSNGVPFAIDKTMLQTSTTEFCFNSGGYYEIESTGIISDKAGVQVAERKLRAIVKIFDIWRQTTQEQFAEGIKSKVQTYPEFDYESSTISPANYDGQIMLATLEEISPNSGVHFRINFNEDKDMTKNDMNADSSGGGWSSQTAYPGTNPNEDSIVKADNNGNLFPDGVFISQNENDVDLSYSCTTQGISSTRGTVEIWLKPNWSGNEVSFPKDPWNSGIIFQTSDYGNYWTSTMSIDVWANDKKIVTKFYPSDAETNYWSGYFYWIGNSITNWKPGEWHHIALTWDFPSVSQKLYFDGNEVASTTAPVGPNPFQTIRIGVDTEEKEMIEGVIDEVRVFPDLRNVATDFAAGRYYDSGDSYFESSKKEVGKARLGTISWTEHARDKDGIEIIPGADIQFDIYDGSVWLGNYENRTNPAGASLNHLTSGTGGIKYKGYVVETGSTLLDTPVLDDVTITYIKAIEILYWKEVI